MASKQEEEEREGEEEEEREGEEFASSDSDRGEEGSDYEEQDDEEIEQAEENQACSSESPSSDQDRKSQNVAALVRYATFPGLRLLLGAQVIGGIAESRVSVLTDIDEFGRFWYSSM